MQFTASAELRAKIERATALMRHQNPRGDLAIVVERAFDSLIAELETHRLGKVKEPRANLRRSRSGYVARAVRREVFARDGERCTFVDKYGRRCEERAFLELEHHHPRALGGSDDASNLAVMCRRHNAFMAECIFGRAHVERKKSARRYPRQRGYENERALHALAGLGFKKREIQRAFAAISQAWLEGEPPIEDVLRQSLALLTQQSALLPR